MTVRQVTILRLVCNYCGAVLEGREDEPEGELRVRAHRGGWTRNLAPVEPWGDYCPRERCQERQRGEA